MAKVAAPPCIHLPISLTSYPHFEVSIATDIGGRKHQEDRFTFCPSLMQGRDDCAFFGVFDGTVGDFASDTVKDLVVPHLLESPGWLRIKQLQQQQQQPHQQQQQQQQQGNNIDAATPIPQLLAESIVHMYGQADKELVGLCECVNNDYASSTAVTAVVVAGYIGVGHLGDSRLAMGVHTPEGLVGEFLTVDHKPDMQEEMRRIVRSGGTVEYLQNHNNRPFIRGGDFSERKSQGGTPMQLQYSRAFGGKDLKCYGLSNIPGLRVLKLTSQHSLMVLATDGLWDVLHAHDAVNIAAEAHRTGMDPASALISRVLSEQLASGGAPDNITAMVVFFKNW